MRRLMLGGRARRIVSNEERAATTSRPLWRSTWTSLCRSTAAIGQELEVDAICDGKDVFIPGIMEHVEHGPSDPPLGRLDQRLSDLQRARKPESQDKILDYTVKLGLRIGIVGLYNIQFIVAGEDDVYVIEVNPRSSRTVPSLE